METTAPDPGTTLNRGAVSGAASGQPHRLRSRQTYASGHLHGHANGALLSPSTDASNRGIARGVRRLRPIPTITRPTAGLDSADCCGHENGGPIKAFPEPARSAPRQGSAAGTEVSTANWNVVGHPACEERAASQVRSSDCISARLNSGWIGQDAGEARNGDPLQGRLNASLPILQYCLTLSAGI